MSQQNYGYMQDTPVLRPSKEEFSKPFCEYVAKVLKKHPNIPMFKVIPPEGWKPRRSPIRLHKLNIQCPIKQHAYGTKGSYRCILVEQKTLSADEFKDIAEDPDHAPPKKVRDGEDKLLERSFWSSVTINPPLYGADTPMSLFDEKLPYGWNLNHLEGCLLKRPDVPQVPGVTSPMTYFGMWKAFFAWHVEDADLFSINYLHFGAPKVWYCVSPSNRAKFERMCQSIFPELHKSCHAFMRHKDILLSPGLLRTYGIEYMQAKQEPNEFIVLNASAYHAGYNMGFNCAEAVNFAPPSWIDIGRNVVRCKCRDDGVRLSMRLFGCESGSSATSSEEETSSDISGSSNSEESEEVSSAEREEEEEEEETSAAAGRRRVRVRRSSNASSKQKERRPRSSSSSGKKERRSKKEKEQEDNSTPAAVVGERRSKRNAAAAAALNSPGSKRSRLDAVGPSSPRPGPRQTKTSRAAAEAAQRMRRTHATAEARARLAVQRGRTSKRGDGSSSHRARPSRAKKNTADLEDSLQRAAAAAAAIRARQQQQQASQQQQEHGDDDEEQEVVDAAAGGCVEQQPQASAGAAVVKTEQQEVLLTRSHSHGGQAAAAAEKAEADSAAAGGAGGAAAAEGGDHAGAVGPQEPDSPTATKARLSNGGKLKHEVDAAAAAESAPSEGLGFGVRGGAGSERLRRASSSAAAAAAAADGPSGEAPKVILGDDNGSKYFYMVQVLREHKAKRRGHLVMRWLKEGKDGLFRPSTDTWEEPASTLVGVRTQWVAGRNGKPGGYRLLTLRSRIVDTQLLD